MKLARFGGHDVVDIERCAALSAAAVKATDAHQRAICNALADFEASCMEGRADAAAESKERIARLAEADAQAWGEYLAQIHPLSQ
jgi:hypothetical protein